MGIDENFMLAFLKAEIAAGNPPPRSGKVFISVKDSDKTSVVPIAQKLSQIGFKIVATYGTYNVLVNNGVNAEKVLKVMEGRPHIVDLIKNGEIAMVINTTFGKKATEDSFEIRRSAITYNVPYFTTISAAKIVADAMGEIDKKNIQVKSIQEYNKTVAARHKAGG